MEVRVDIAVGRAMDGGVGFKKSTDLALCITYEKIFRVLSW